MSTLINKTYRTKNYTSRYTNYPYYYNVEDDKYIYGITGYLDSTTGYTIHNVKDTDTLDYLAMKYYGRPDLYWVIADFNRIVDSYIDLYNNYSYIYIPNLGEIKFK